jgi:hypothetical protein
LRNALIGRRTGKDAVGETHRIGTAPGSKAGNQNDCDIPQETFGRMLQNWETHVQLVHTRNSVRRLKRVNVTRWLRTTQL